MSSFLVRTATRPGHTTYLTGPGLTTRPNTRPGHTTRLNTRPGHTTRLNTRPGLTTRLTQNRNHEIPQTPRQESRSYDQNPGATPSFLTNPTRPGHATRLSQNRNHEIPKTPRPESRSYDQNPGAKRLRKFTRQLHPMPLRRWGALLLVALFFLAHTVHGGRCGTCHKDNGQHKFNDSKCSQCQDDEHKATEPEPPLLHVPNAMQMVPGGAVKTEGNGRDLKARVQVFHNKTYDARDFERRLKANALELDYKGQVLTALKTITQAGGKVQKLDTEEYERKMIKKKGCWQNKSGQTAAGATVDDRVPRSRDNNLRVMQYNILAHGLCDKSSGFANMYKSDNPKAFPLPIHLTSEKEFTSFLEKKDMVLGRAYDIKRLTLNSEDVLPTNVLVDCKGCKETPEPDCKCGGTLKVNKYDWRLNETDDESHIEGTLFPLASIVGDAMKNFGKHYAKCKTYQKWEKINLIPQELRNIMCAVTKNDLKELLKTEETYLPARFKRVLAQTLRQCPDIVTYQELDQYERFKMELGEYGYDGVFFQKIGSQAGRFNGQGYKGYEYDGRDDWKWDMYDKNHDGSDGAAVFWDTKLFRMISEETKQININDISGKGKNPKKKEYAQPFGRVVLINKKTDEKIAVYVSHNKSGDATERKIKEYQACQIAKEIRDYKKNNANVRVIYAADFNCHFEQTPEDKTNKEKNGTPSPVNGSTPHAIFHDIISEKVKDYKLKSNWFVGHNHVSWMRSAYKQFLHHEPDYTTAKWRKGGEQLTKIENRQKWLDEHKNEDFGKETEDYIFYSERDFNVKAVLDIPTYDELTPLIGKKDQGIRDINLLPNWKHPSDHFHIQVDLEYAKKTSLSYTGESRSITTLVRTTSEKKYLKTKSLIISDSKKTEKKSWYTRTVLEKGDVGTVVETDITRSDGKCVKVRWGEDSNGKPINRGFDGNAFEGWTNANVTSIKPPKHVAQTERTCGQFSGLNLFRQKVKTAKDNQATRSADKERRDQARLEKKAKKKGRTRRMAQREFSSRRDSPVMVRLLEQIIAAQDD